MANGSFGHRGPRAEAFLSRARGPQVPGLVQRRSIDRSTNQPADQDASRLVSFPLVSFYFARGKATGRYEAISSARLTKVRRGPAKRLPARFGTPRIRIDEDRCNVSNHSSRQGQEEEPRILAREERRNEAKWIGPPVGAARRESACTHSPTHTRVSLEERRECTRDMNLANGDK